MLKNSVLLRITIAFVLMYAYLPVYIFFDHDYHQPFIFFYIKDGITWYHYADYLGTRLSIIVLVHLVVKLTTKVSREYLFIFFWLWIGYIIEYLLVFNQPFARWHSIPLSYSLPAGLSMIILTFHQWRTRH